MCGIFVAYSIESDFKDCSNFHKATEHVSHRGPDNLGCFHDSKCFLGHTRLAIVGLDQSSNQPFFFKDLVLVFNGEIFNYIEIREVLTQQGYVFETTSDTEVVIKAFDYWKLNCFEQFNGMWSIVIYDKLSGELIVSRDRFGQKPLFAMKKDKVIYFASEFQQLVDISDKQIDFELIQKFLKEGTYEGEGRTFFKAIEEFPKAHFFKIYKNGECFGERYWDYPHGPIHNVDDSTFKEFEDMLLDSIKLRLRADVPFGILLSGGVDSTIVASYSRSIVGANISIPAFTYASNDKDDESLIAQQVAKKLDLGFNFRMQDESPDKYLSRLRALVRHMGRGHSSPAIVSIDYLYESVADNRIRVALDGQGADELLAGYTTFFPILIPILVIKGNFNQAWLFTKQFLQTGLLQTSMLFLRKVMPPFLRSMGRRLYGYERFFNKISQGTNSRQFEKIVSKRKNRNAFNRFLIKQHDVGLENLLYYGDIVAMKNSVENRSPFMDHRLVDFVFSRSEKLKVWNGLSKYALRTLPAYSKFKDELDRKKIGFSSNIRLDTKRKMIEELTESEILTWQIFTENLRKFITDPIFLTDKYERLLFRVYQVHIWNQIFNRAG